MRVPVRFPLTPSAPTSGGVLFIVVGVAVICSRGGVVVEGVEYGVCGVGSTINRTTSSVPLVYNVVQVPIRDIE